MTINIQKVPYGNELARLANSATSSFKIISPYITYKGVQYIVQSEVKPKIITRVTASNLSSFALEGKALKHLLILGAEIRSIPNLHAKVYLVDGTKGLVTSSNLTSSGFSKNVELGIYFENEDQLFQSTNSFFTALWSKAALVSLESLELLETQIRSIKSSKGIYRDEEHIDEEDIVPVPAIGRLVYNIREEQTEDTHQIDHLQFDHEEQDESGDYFAPLPTNVFPLIESLKSSNDRRIQTVINSLGLSSAEDFREWLEDLSTTDFKHLVSQESVYPYKRYVVKKIIKDGSVLHLGLLIKYLISDISNETQFGIYYDYLLSRVQVFTKDDKSEFVELMSDAIQFLSEYINNGQIDGRKNFSKPNLDKVLYLMTICGGHAASVDIKLSSEKEDIIPGYQEIKRNRESLGDDFWNYAEQYFKELSLGAWNNNLPSINSLFKELQKIKITVDQKRQIRNVANDVVKSMDVMIVRVRPELIHDFQLMAANYPLSSTEREQLQKAFDELKYSTGRLVQIYGQWTKEERIEKSSEIKKKLDYMSTFFSTINTIKKWI